MEPVLGVLLLIWIGVAYYLIRRGISKGIAAGVRGARKAVASQQGATLTGQNSVYTEINFSVPVSGAVLFDKIELTLAAPTEQPTLIHALFRAGRDQSSLTFAYGSKVAVGLVYVIALAGDDGSSCRGTAQAVRWTEDAGLVTVGGTVGRIHKHVTSAVEAFGGSFSVAQNTKSRTTK